MPRIPFALSALIVRVFAVPSCALVFFDPVRVSSIRVVKLRARDHDGLGWLNEVDADLLPGLSCDRTHRHVPPASLALLPWPSHRLLYLWTMAV